MCIRDSLHTGHSNELWSYGEENYRIMKHYYEVRMAMKEYIKGPVSYTHLDVYKRQVLVSGLGLQGFHCLKLGGGSIICLCDQ